tara:strand:- start:1498 stop:2349 length:852 start_codon:yes stop_codon:yes gene_type:complete
MKKIMFISDMFSEDYPGGAELTTEAFIRSMPNTHVVAKVHSAKVTPEIIDANNDAHFIVCNFAALEDSSKLHMCKNADYSIVEYDYKLCKYRSLKKHELAEGKPCDCLEGMDGKITQAFYGYAKRVLFMSAGQRDIFLSRLKTLKQENTFVLSSAFLKGDLNFMESIKDNEKNNKYLILGSNSWIKGTKECIAYAEENNLEYEVIQGLPYHELLIKMSTSKGLIFRPLDYDTCPRIVIEAKLLGCDLILNEYVQHKDEEWFATQQSSYEYLRSRPSEFWSFYE